MRWHLRGKYTSSSQSQVATSFNKKEAKDDAYVQDALKDSILPYLLGKRAFIASHMY